MSKLAVLVVEMRGDNALRVFLERVGLADKKIGRCCRRNVVKAQERVRAVEKNQWIDLFKYS